MCNNNWNKLKTKFKKDFEKYNYKRNNYEQVICSISLQEAIGTLLKVKYSVDSVRKLPEPYKELEDFTRQILNLMQQRKN